MFLPFLHNNSIKSYNQSKYQKCFKSRKKKATKLSIQSSNKYLYKKLYNISRTSLKGKWKKNNSKAEIQNHINKEINDVIIDQNEFESTDHFTWCSIFSADYSVVSEPKHLTMLTSPIQSDSLDYLVCAYIRNTDGHLSIYNDIIAIIRLYCMALPQYSMKCIAATHLIASTIYEHLNDKQNRCEFNDELSKDVLKYIYVRGGAIRDCCLLRKIKDIDIVVDINTLNKRYLQHLQTYHLHKPPDTNCIFYRHYLNQFHWNSQKTEIHESLRSVGEFDAINARNKFHPDSVDRFLKEPTSNKIYNYGARISNCDWVINSRFFFNILLKSDLEEAIKIECRKTNWTLILNNYIYQNMTLKKISFDFADSSGQAYGQRQTLKKLKSSFGLFNAHKVVAGIDTYYRYYADINNYTETATHYIRDIFSYISIPIHPTEMNLFFYDFTINALHLSFDSVLRNKSRQQCIDFDWGKKVSRSYHENQTINIGNAMGLKDINAKILKAPYINTINACTANFYFWRLVKTAQKWITEIENSVWKIDPIYLQHTINHYSLWFDKFNFDSRRDENVGKFINKFLHWNINSVQDIIDRLRVFRYIKFADRFKKLLASPHVNSRRLEVIFQPVIYTDATRTRIYICAPYFKVFNVDKDMSKYINERVFAAFVRAVEIRITQSENKTWKIDETYLQFIVDVFKVFVGRNIDKLLVWYKAVFYPMIDTDAKIISAPLFKLLNMNKDVSKLSKYINESIFWKFVETVQNFIGEIENKIWKIDRRYLQCIVDSHSTWVNAGWKYSYKYLIQGYIINKNVIDRLKVFTYIGFHKHIDKFILKNHMVLSQLNSLSTRTLYSIPQPYLTKILVLQHLSYKKSHRGKSEVKFKDCKMYKHCRYYWDDFPIKHNYYFNENNVKLSEKIKKKWNQKKMKSMKYQRRNDRKQNAKAIEKFKKRYALCLQY